MQMPLGTIDATSVAKRFARTAPSPIRSPPLTLANGATYCRYGELRTGFGRTWRLTMRRLRPRDLRALLGCVRDSYALRDLAVFPHHVVVSLRQVVPPQCCLYHASDP